MTLTVWYHRYSLTVTPSVVLSLAAKGRMPNLHGVSPRTCKILWNKACRTVGLAV